MPSPKLVPLVLSGAERASLEALSRRRTTSQSLAERARVVVACADEGGVATKSADEILETLAAYCQRIIDSGH